MKTRVIEISAKVCALQAFLGDRWSTLERGTLDAMTKRADALSAPPVPEVGKVPPEPVAEVVLEYNREGVKLVDKIELVFGDNPDTKEIETQWRKKRAGKRDG
jgi:hypothetical protein